MVGISPGASRLDIGQGRLLMGLHVELNHKTKDLLSTWSLKLEALTFVSFVDVFCNSPPFGPLDALMLVIS